MVDLFQFFSGAQSKSSCSPQRTPVVTTRVAACSQAPRPARCYCAPRCTCGARAGNCPAPPACLALRKQVQHGRARASRPSCRAPRRSRSAARTASTPTDPASARRRQGVAPPRRSPDAAAASALCSPWPRSHPRPLARVHESPGWLSTSGLDRHYCRWHKCYKRLAGLSINRCLTCVSIDGGATRLRPPRRPRRLPTRHRRP